MRAETVETLAFVVPAAAAGALWAWRRPAARQRTAMLLGAVWVFATVLPLSALAERLGWWRFTPRVEGGTGMPVALLLGWVVAWGMLPVLALPRVPAWVAAALALWLDLLLMPR